MRRLVIHSVVLAILSSCFSTNRGASETVLHESNVRLKACNNSAKEDELPLIATFTTPKGHVLRFVAVEHGNNIDDASHRLITRSFSDHTPSVLLIEGLDVTDGINPGSRLRSARSQVASGASSENAYAIFLASKSGVPVAGADLGVKQLASISIKAGFRSQDVAGAHILRLLNARHGQDEERIVSEVLQYFVSYPELVDFNFERWFSKQYGRPFSTADLKEGTPCGDGIGAMIVKSESIERNRNLERIIMLALADLPYVLVVFGGGHFLDLQTILSSKVGSAIITR